MYSEKSVLCVYLEFCIFFSPDTVELGGKTNAVVLQAGGVIWSVVGVEWGAEVVVVRGVVFAL